MRRWGLLLVTALILAGCQPRGQTVTPTTTAMTGCAPPATYLARGRPSPCLTPGVVRTSDPKVICVAGHASKVRHELTSAEWSIRRAEVMRAYGLASLKGRTVDHVLPLEGGGSNDVGNLFPAEQAAAKDKDRAEAGLHAGICKPGITTAKVRVLQAAFLRQWGGTP
jgi:hypothetical protein